MLAKGLPGFGLSEAAILESAQGRGGLKGRRLQLCCPFVAWVFLAFRTDSNFRAED